MGLRGAAPENQSHIEQNLTAEPYAHFDAHGCDGGCDCTWLSQDNCDDQSWCCAWACRNNYGNPQNCEDTDWCCAGACRDYYYNPKGCNGPALLANESGVNATLKGSPDSGLCTQVWTCPAFQLCRWTCV